MTAKGRRVTLRLGLHDYDQVSHRIMETDDLGEPAGRIYADLFAALRSGDGERIARAFTRTWNGC